MKENGGTKSVKLNIRVTTEAHEKLLAGFRKTTFRIFTDYLRALLERKPVTIYYRNKSLDEFLEAAYAIKEELFTVARNFDRAVKGFAPCAEGQKSNEALDFLCSEELLVRLQIAEIKDLLIKIYDKCSH